MNGGMRLANKRVLIIDRGNRHAGRHARAMWTATYGSAGEWAKRALDGVTVFNPDGKPIGRIDLPERCANLCFGGMHRNRLFMAAARRFIRCSSILRARSAAEVRTKKRSRASGFVLSQGAQCALVIALAFRP